MRALVCLFALASPMPLAAQGVPGFCASAKLVLARDRDLAKAAAAAFPVAAPTSRDENCLYPFQLLHYSDADVLISTGDTPGDACHGCAATLSATVMRRLAGHFRVVARFEKFGLQGTLGDPGRVTAIQLAGHDSFAVESGGTFQGYTSVRLTIYVFHNGRLVEATPRAPLSASHEGGMAQDSISVDGAWYVSPGRSDAIVVDYKVSAGGPSRRTSATWVLVEDKLVLLGGRVPPEFHRAAGD